MNAMLKMVNLQLHKLLIKDTKDKIEDLDLNLYENFYSEQDLSDDTMIRIYKK